MRKTAIPSVIALCMMQCSVFQQVPDALSNYDIRPGVMPYQNGWIGPVIVTPKADGQAGLEPK